MLKHVRIRQLNDFFMKLGERSEKGVFFYRINGYNRQIGEFIRNYYETARAAGVVIEGRIPNPDEKNLSYYDEIMGRDFQLNKDFIAGNLKKWLPRMNDYQRNMVSNGIYDTLENLKKSGKNDNVLKNVYIKFMCWLYYKFERIVSQLGDDAIPKILYEGDVSNHELLLLRVLSLTGCDIVLLQYAGDDNYLRFDASSSYSEVLNLPDMEAFPPGFSLKKVRDEIQNVVNTERLYGQKAAFHNFTNYWIQGKGLEDFKTNLQNRGNDKNLYYNCYCRINGVEDKLLYTNELYQFYLELKNSKRRIVVENGEIPKPSMDEINRIKRKNYTRTDQMIMDLSGNITCVANVELQRIMIKSFVDVVLEEEQQSDGTLNKLTNKAVYLLCWLKRYQDALFGGWKMPEIACFIHMGGCKQANEALFLKFLARLPVDVLILVPNLDTKCCLNDSLLFEKNYQESLKVEKFPQDNAQLHIGTAAYHAERELDNLMYRDTGMYRNQQYGKAMAINLQTMYEEIPILWKEEMKYRPNFSTIDDVVNMPVIFAKASGVKGSQLRAYWAGIKDLITDQTLVIRNGPFIDSTEQNPIKAYATDLFKHGKLQKNKIKSHPAYPYGVLRDEIQEHILDKLQLLIDERIIKGTFENGTEYMIVSIILNMKKEVVRMIQKFDFTKRNPKVIYINTTDTNISLEDSILMAFLNLLGFDILFFVPTGYQTVERFFNRKLMEEHQVGDYMYDLNIPDFGSLPSATRSTWRDKIFKRGT